MHDLQSIVGDYETFLKTVLRELQAAGFDLADFAQMDHMCYRVPDAERYAAKKQELAGVARLLDEKPVNGRPISTYRLHQPVRYQDWRIDAVELPAPKAGTAPAEGLEHVEMVLFDDFPAFLAKYPGKDFDMVSAERGINPEISLALPTTRVKFHLLSLPTVVYLERKLGIASVQN